MGISPATSPDTDVVIVGAGPSGLTAALVLARYGVRVRVVDCKCGPVRQSRATLVHARTLEYFDQLGLAGRSMSHGVPIEAVEIHEGSRALADVPLSEPSVEGMTRFPCALSVRQSDIERLLVDALAEWSVPVEWESTVEAFTADTDGIRTLVHVDGRVETIHSHWLVGADGARSVVRRHLGLAFSGHTYPQTALLADADLGIAGVENRLRLNLTRGGFMGILPLGGTEYRLFGAVPEGFVAPRLSGEISHDAYSDLDREDLQQWFEQYFDIDGELGAIKWASLFRFHSRIADRFRVGNVFLVGDAAHIHNPAGGQGLNLGVGEAVNLAWKIAHVARQEAPPSLIDTYESERRPVAETIMRNTDRGFRLETVQNPVGLWLRSQLAVRFLERLARLPKVRRAMFRMLSQTWISYRDSPAVSKNRDGGPLLPGDRAPHVPTNDATGSLLDITRSNGYHLLVFEELDRVLPEPSEVLRRRITAQYRAPVHVHTIPPSQAAAWDVYGASRGRLVLLRPDGHIAWISPDTGDDDAHSLIEHLDAVLLRAPNEGSPVTA